MFENEGDCVAVEADVKRVQHAAHHGYAEMCLYHGRDVGKHDGDRFAMLQTVLFESARQLSAANISVRPAAPDFSMNNGCPVRISRGRTLDEAQRR